MKTHSTRQESGRKTTTQDTTASRLRENLTRRVVPSNSFGAANQVREFGGAYRAAVKAGGPIELRPSEVKFLQQRQNVVAADEYDEVSTRTVVSVLEDIRGAQGQQGVQTAMLDAMTTALRARAGEQAAYSDRAEQGHYDAVHRRDTAEARWLYGAPAPIEMGHYRPQERRDRVPGVLSLGAAVLITEPNERVDVSHEDGATVYRVVKR